MGSYIDYLMTEEVPGLLSKVNILDRIEVRDRVRKLLLEREELRDVNSDYLGWASFRHRKLIKSIVEGAIKEHHSEAEYERLITGLQRMLKSKDIPDPRDLTFIIRQVGDDKYAVFNGGLIVENPNMQHEISAFMNGIRLEFKVGWSAMDALLTYNPSKIKIDFVGAPEVELELRRVFGDRVI